MLESGSKGAAKFLPATRVLPEIVSFSSSMPSSPYLPYISQVSKGTRNAKGTISSNRVLSPGLGGRWRSYGQKYSTAQRSTQAKYTGRRRNEGCAQISKPSYLSRGGTRARSCRILASRQTANFRTVRKEEKSKPFLTISKCRDG